MGDINTHKAKDQIAGCRKDHKAAHRRLIILFYSAKSDFIFNFSANFNMFDTFQSSITIITWFLLTLPVIIFLPGNSL
ncbi:hypothetical protein M2387_004233 [Klebsiella sp. BIGb0407]|nr:hypothetical protein [Klebsiella sp. BIGb0407]